MNDEMEHTASGFTKVDQTKDPQLFIEFLDARKSIEGERGSRRSSTADRPGG
jgi:hypothetical protein